jgi:hypothetical protein
LQESLLKGNNATFNPNVPSSENVAAFNNSMGNTNVVAETKGIDLIGHLTNQAKSEAIAPEDEILMALQKISSSHSNKVQTVSEHMNTLGTTDAMSPKDLIRRQNLAFEYQMYRNAASKAVNSFISGTQTLFRKQ